MKKLNIAQRCAAIDRWVSAHFVTRFLTSHICLAFFYGAFLFLYELHYLQEIIPAIHPLLIAWAGMLAAYDLLIRRVWTGFPGWKLLLLFGVCTGISVVLNREAGLVGNVKTWILTVLPLLVFYPICLIAGKARKKAFILAGLGGAIVMFAACLLALCMYVGQISMQLELWGIVHSVGVLLYDRTNPESGLLLYGFFRDTNHAANFAIVFAVYSWILLRAARQNVFKHKWQNVLGQIFAVANLVVQLLYFPLANSRGAWLTLIAASVITMALYFYFKRLTVPKRFAKALIAFALSVIVSAAMCGGLLLVRSAVTQMPDAYVRLSQAIDEMKKPTVEPTKPSAADEPTEDPTVTPTTDATQPSAETEVTEAPTTEATQPSTEATQPSTEATQPPTEPEPIIPPYTENPEINEAWGNFEKNNESFGAGRLVIWKDALRLVMERPLFGQCPDNTKYFAQLYGHEGEMARGSDIHNSYIDLLIDYGIVGFVLLIGFWCACAWMVLKALATRGREIDPETFDAGLIVLMCAGAALLLSCVFINTTAMYFAMVLGLSYMMANWADFKKEDIKK